MKERFDGNYQEENHKMNNVESGANGTSTNANPTANPTAGNSMANPTGYSSGTGTTGTNPSANPGRSPYNNGTNAGTGASGSNPYSYQNGYYRNTTLHQDEPVYSGSRPSSYGSSYGSTGSYGSNGYSNPTPTPTPKSGSDGGSNGGYSYVNYYSNGSDGKTPKDKKPKKKYTGLKICCLILAIAVISGASIGIYEGVQETLESSDDSTTILSSSSSASASSTSADSSDDSTASDSDSESSSGSSGESWIELASADGSMMVSEIVEKVTPSVVGVTATYTSSSSSDSSYYNFFGYGYDDGSSSRSTATGVGTGIIMSEDGYIITNAHVIYDEDYGYGEATAVQITMSDEETTYDAEIIAYDVESDLAVLKIDATELTAAEFGDSSQLKVGEMVVAIGNPLGLEFQNTVTCGIISALNREVTINDKEMTLIQTDTAINSGSSGGPLINSSGQVIGINSAKMSSSYSSSSASVEGMGFAISMTEVQEIIDDLINYGYVTGRPQFGITCQDVSESVAQAYKLPVGCYVVSVTDGGAADQAGIQVGDVITGIQGEEVSTTEELNNIKNTYSAGDVITLTIVRSSETIEVEVTLEEANSSTSSSESSEAEENDNNNNNNNGR